MILLILFIIPIMIAIVVIGVAMYMRQWWTALFVCIGTVLGAVLAVVPLWLMMEKSAAETGFDAGNAGVFFVCTIPVFTIIGVVIGAVIGQMIDRKS